VSNGELTIDQVNALADDAFVDLLGQVYESTPALAAAALGHRPFLDRAALIDAFKAAAGRLDEPSALALLRAHPQLAIPAAMTTASRHEQRSAGLSNLDDATRARLVAGNARYLDRFGFPFIIAVSGLTPADIVAALDDRLDHDPNDELATARRQVDRIAELRVTRLVSP
jgi:2-oxo-4-hydroxy-4-carboxy-5-ureidoimidazoline decarboxylase